IADKAEANVQVVEMPPGPPVLQSVVAEVTGPDAITRRRVATDMLGMFSRSKSIVDVDSYMQAPHEIWRFEVDTEKAVRRGVSVDTINRNLGMAMGGAQLGDVKRGTVLEPTYIVIQVPMEVRSKISSLADLPVSTPKGDTVPLGELGRFVKAMKDDIVFHKDLRPVEYVTGEVTGKLDAPIYGMFEVEDMLKKYVTPDGVTMAGEFMGAPKNYSKSGFEWTGEWTVTYETFRDMGLAFGVALILIYMLVVWEFGNFMLPAIIMAPIPLTLLGIVPGHWLLGAKFTATSMIGFIALAGIIVRNSILLVDFTQQEILKGVSVREAVILSCKARTRPIIITALALVAGSSVILGDFIFQGMAISLLFGALISTLLTLLVIPLGCVSAQRAFVMPKAPYPQSIRVTAEPPVAVASKPTVAPTVAPVSTPPVTQEAAPVETVAPAEPVEEDGAANKKESGNRRGIRLKPPQGEASSTGESN
ncbi:MAG: efflux RND transporter permease subunit, partial [Magnetococcales bacterium]|nr:efflux RND transporter permease subunit [Magnetococcales bacterium]